MQANHARKECESDTKMRERCAEYTHTATCHVEHDLSAQSARIGPQDELSHNGIELLYMKRLAKIPHSSIHAALCGCTLARNNVSAQLR